MIRDVGESVANAVIDGAGRLAGRAQERRPLPTDLLESDDAYLVVFDAPGVSSEDIRVGFSENAVHIRIDRVRELREDFEMRFPGRGLGLDGRAELPAGAAVDPENATATLTDTGTLEVELPKVSETADEPIRISTDEDAPDAAGGSGEGADDLDSAVERIEDDETDG